MKSFKQMNRNRQESYYGRTFHGVLLNPSHGSAEWRIQWIGLGSKPMLLLRLVNITGQQAAYVYVGDLNA